MKQIRKNVWIAIIGVLPLMSAVYLFLPRVPTLILRNESGGIVVRIPCEDGRFTHRYVHSIHLTNVDEDFQIQANGTLLLTATKFDTLGVGIPYDADGGFSMEGNRFVLKMNRRYRSLPIRVSPMPGHLIITGGRNYPLTNWFVPEDLVVVEAKNLPRLWAHPAPMGNEEKR